MRKQLWIYYATCYLIPFCLPLKFRKKILSEIFWCLPANPCFLHECQALFYHHWFHLVFSNKIQMSCYSVFQGPCIFMKKVLSIHQTSKDTMLLFCHCSLSRLPGAGFRSISQQNCKCLHATQLLISLK